MFGGGSSHNFGLTVRGSKLFYDGNWSEYLGRSYEELVQYFKKIENYKGKSQNINVRGTGGQLIVSQVPTKINFINQGLGVLYKSITSGPGIIAKSFDVYRTTKNLRASENFSNNLANIISNLKKVPIVEDYNTGISACVTKTQQLFIDPLTGIRSSTDIAYLKTSDNLTIISGATCDKINEDSVQWIDSDMNIHNMKLNEGGKIIICGGAIYSPFILQKSGFKNVGGNLTTHYGCTMVLSVEADNDEDFNFRVGPLAFLPRNYGNRRDWEILCTNMDSINTKILEDEGIYVEQNMKKDPKLRYFGFLFWILDPQTRGNVTVDEDNIPKIELKLFEDNEDVDNILDGLKFMYDISLKLKEHYPTMKVVYPPENIFRRDDKDEMIDYIKKGVSMTDHYCSTCQMGRVVDEHFQLKDSKNIYVVDASVFPSIVDGNTEFGVCLMSEIASEEIIGQLK